MSKEARIERIERQLQRLQDELERIENMPEEPEPGNVIWWEQRFPGSAVKYTYAAIHAGGGWYVTGGHSRIPKGATWEDVMNAIPADTEIWIVNGWDPLT